MPSSFASILNFRDIGEHPSRAEPVVKGSFEYDARIAAAQTYTNVMVIRFLELWANAFGVTGANQN
jgi:hypothetical protein